MKDQIIQKPIQKKLDQTENPEKIKAIALNIAMIVEVDAKIKIEVGAQAKADL